VKAPLYPLKYGAPADRQWLREVMNRDTAAVFTSLGPDRLDVAEISGDLRANIAWKSYRSFGYPDWDLCTSDFPEASFDLVICEQVLEHVPDPVAAVRSLRSMTREGGAVFVSTPFLLRIHGHPNDYWRFTPAGMERLLTDGGLRVDWVRSWGNRGVVRANFGRWAFYRRWRSLKNDPDLPIVVWALAHR
jgi:SAM-dependent methyltransferase